MAANPLPILALAAGAYFLLRAKDEPEAKPDEKGEEKPKETKVTPLQTEQEQVEEHKEQAESGNAPDRNPREPLPTETFNVIREERFNNITEPITFRPTDAGDTLTITDFDDSGSVYWLAGTLRDGNNNLLAELAKDSTEGVISLRSPQGLTPTSTIKLMRTQLSTDNDFVLAYLGPRPPSLGEPSRPLVVEQIEFATAMALPDAQKPSLRPQGPGEAIQIDGFDGAQYGHWLSNNTKGLAKSIYRPDPDPNVDEGTLFLVAETGDVDVDPITLNVIEKNQTGAGDVLAWM